MLHSTNYNKLVRDFFLGVKIGPVFWRNNQVPDIAVVALVNPEWANDVQVPMEVDDDEEQLDLGNNNFQQQ